MDWLDNMNAAIEYIEMHLADEEHYSPTNYQKKSQNLLIWFWLFFIINHTFISELFVCVVCA